MSKIITVYYSHKGENYWNGSIKNLKKGNTEIVAEFIHKAVGGDIFEVQTLKEYAENYYICTEEAQKELQENARPELKAYPENLESYDIIFAGFPNWWGTMPMAMFTLFEKFDLKGKKIVPFCTNEGSGMGSSEKDLVKVCRGANVMRGLAICGTKSSDSEEQVFEWARRNI